MGLTILEAGRDCGIGGGGGYAGGADAEAAG
jgi:hypothetical protein